MTLNMALAPMALSATTFNAGDKVRVTVDFKYTVESDATMHLYACPYYTNIPGQPSPGLWRGFAWAYMEPLALMRRW